MPTKDQVTLRKCPFCQGNIIEKQDDCGGSWIEHIEKPRRGSMQLCVLTGVRLNTSSRTHCEWNHRPEEDRLKAMCEELAGALQGILLYIKPEYKCNCGKCDLLRSVKNLLTRYKQENP